jgi:protein-disulfide isomerase
MPRYREWFLNTAVTVVTCLALVMAALRVRDDFFRPKPPDPYAPSIVADWDRYGGGDERIGPAHAPVTIVEFADFQCPYCRKAALDLRAVQAQYPNQVAIVFRNFPLSGHAQARPAAWAGECARRAGRFAAFYDTVYSQQDSLGHKSWIALARDAGVADTATFASCMTDSTRWRAIVADMEAAGHLGVQATPTFLINNLEIPAYPGAERLDSYVADAIRRSR